MNALQLFPLSVINFLMYFRNFIGHFLPVLLFGCFFFFFFKESRWNRGAGRCVDIVTLISAENHFLIKSLCYFLDSVSQ